MKINIQKIHPRNLVVRWIIAVFSILAISLASTFIEVNGLKECVMFGFVYVFLYSLSMMLYEIITINILEKIDFKMLSILMISVGRVIIDYIVFVFSLFFLANKGIIYYRKSFVVYIICFILQMIGTQLFKKGDKKTWQRNRSY